MAEKIDPKLTQGIQEWLDQPAESRDLVAGASLLLKLNRNRAFYNTVVRRPQKFAAKLEYELKKFLRIRLDGMTRSAIVELESKVMPEAKRIIDVAEEMPASTKHKGRRPDHDQLPKHIQDLWDGNFEVYKLINLLFEELKAMSRLQPCDRYDKLQLLAAADERYRDNLRKYDAYVIGTEAEQPPHEDAAKKISAARKTISKWRSRLDGLDGEAKESAVATIQNCVSVVLDLHGGFSQSTVEELKTYGIKF